MKRTLFSSLVPVVCAVAILWDPVSAAVPQILNYQGRVAVGATNFDGTGQFKFALVDAAGTTSYWSNDGTGSAGSEPTTAVPLAVVKGLYSVLLGDTSLANMTAIPTSVFGNSDVRLRVWFDDGTNGSQLLTPDQRVAAVGYAMNSAGVAANSVGTAQIIDGSLTGTDIAAGTITGSKLATNTVTSSKIADGTVRLQELDTPSVDTRYRSRDPRTVIVDRSGDGDFKFIADALSSISPTATAPYVLEVRAGTYVESVVMKSYVHLRGAGRDLVTLSSPASPGSGAEAVGLRMTGLSGVEVSGFTFMPAPGGVADFGIEDVNSSPVVRDCRFRGFEGAFGAEPAAISSTGSSPVITSCEFSASNKAGILLTTAKARIHDCRFFGDGFALFGIWNRGSEAQVTGCRFEDLDHAILNEQMGATPSKAMVTGNRFYRVARGVQNPANCTAVVTGNHFDDDNVNGGMVGVGNDGSVSVTGNTFRFCETAVIEFGTAATISGNHIEGCGAAGEKAIAVFNPNAVVDGNVFANNTFGDLATGGNNVRLANVDGVALDLDPGEGIRVTPKLMAPLGVGAGPFNIVSDFQVEGNAMLGTGFTASALQNTGILNMLSGINADGNSNGIRFFENTSSFSMALGYDGTGSGSSNALRIYDNGATARFSFENGGNLGIGVTNPTSRLHVAGDAIISGGLKPGDTAAAMTIAADTIDAPATLDINAGANLTVDAGTTLQLEGTVVNVTSAATLTLQGGLVSISGLGTLGINGSNGGFTLGVNGSAAKPGGGSWSFLSDARLKKNVRPLDGSLDRLLALRGVTYEYKDPTFPFAVPGIQTGMIAQEVEEIFPDWVDERDDGFKVLTFRGFEALTVEALRELSEEKDAAIRNLRSENAALKRRLDRQASRATAIEQRLSRLEKCLPGASLEEVALKP